MIAGLLVGSGFCALVYQTAWMRMFRVLFGSSTLATSAVLAIFMAGLGFGGWRLGRYAQRHARPLRLYAQLELVIGVGAALSPLLLALARIIYIAIGGSQTLGNVGATALRLVLATLVIGAPVVVMGGTLPAAARAATRANDTGRKTVALLYGANTIGGVIGALVPTFITLEAIGTRATLWLAAGINLAIGGLAWWLSRTIEPMPVEPEAPTVQVRTRWVLGAAFVTGFVFLLAELIWYRMAAPILGGSTFTFGIILAWALLGIGVGGLLYSLLGPATATPAHFALTCALEALALIAPFVAGDRIAVVAIQVQHLSGSGFGYLIAGWSLIACMLVFPAAVIAGYQFPALLALAGRGSDGIARDVGRIYAANTLGAILGALLGGFALLPLMSAPNAWRFVAVAMVGVAIAAGVIAKPTRRLVPAGIVAVLALVGATARGPTAMWRHTGIGAGRGIANAANRNALVDALYTARRELIYERDGIESSLGVIDNRDGIAFYMNGKSDGSALADAWTTQLLGAIGGVLHPHPKTALVIGLGSSETAGVLARDPLIEHVDVAELEPAVIRYAQLCGAASFDALANPKLTLHIGDARELVATTRATYDLIASEPSNPYRAGVSSLFSLEFYEQARARLAPGGMFLQWIQGYEIDPRAFAIAVATMHTAFEHVSVWVLGLNDYMLLGTDTPLVLDVARVAKRLGEEPYRTALGRIAGIYDVEALAARHLAGDAFAASCADGVDIVSTDDLPIIEYLFARSVGRGFGVEAPDILASAAAKRDDRIAVTGALDWNRFEYMRFRPWHVQEVSAPRMPVAPSVVPWLQLWSTVSGNPSAETQLARNMGIEAPLPPVPAYDLFERLVRLEVLAISPAQDRTAFASEAAQLRTSGLPGDVAWAELAAALVDRRVADIAATLPSAFDALRADPWLRHNFVDKTLKLLLDSDNAEINRATLQQLMVGQFALGVLEPTRQLLAESLAPRLGEWESCAAAFERAEPWPVWTHDLLALRVACYAKVRPAREAAARADLAEFDSNQSSPLTDILARPTTHD